MQIHVHTDKNISGREAFQNYVQSLLSSSVERMADQITRIDVHFKDENGGKAGAFDKRCLIEAHVEGHAPVAVSANSDDVNAATDAAVEKLMAALSKILDLNKGRQRIIAAGPAADAIASTRENLDS